MTRLIDTDVLIDHLRGRPPSIQYLTSCTVAGDRLLYSVISVAELFAGMRPGEEGTTRALLSCLEEIGVDGATAEQAGAYRKAYAKSHGLLLPDALIAATARGHSAILSTTNLKHYPMTDLSIERPY